MISGEFLAYFENGSTISIVTDDYATVNVGSVALSATTTTPNANAFTLMKNIFRFFVRILDMNVLSYPFKQIKPNGANPFSFICFLY